MTESCLDSNNHGVSTNLSIGPLTLPASGPIIWLFAGDSITQGAVHTHGWRDYTQLFKERLGELARNEDVVINTAVGGWSVSALLPRLEERVIRFRPDVVFLMFGTNDCTGGHGGIAQYEDDYGKVLGEIRAAGIDDVIVQTTVPMCPVDPERVVESTRWGDESMREGKLHGLRMRLAHMEQYVEATRRIVQQHGVMAVDHWEAWTSRLTTYGVLTDGGFHPNEYGHRFIAHTLISELGLWDDSSQVCRLPVPGTCGSESRGRRSNSV